ncbi:MAG: DUF1080 domain-containing protein [Planctomycetaceae bacterium]|jgi:hypothetical protein|nr:DUF1080 domain-containing protein [Planctomycetaceae bacterium]
MCADSAFGQVNLFEKRNLADWDFHCDPSGTAAGSVYSFSNDGVLSCKGEPFGYLATKNLYKNFQLSVEYRWSAGAKPTNSGIFLRLKSQPENTFLPQCYEVQLGHGRNGDIWGFHGMTLTASEDTKSRFSERDGGAKLGHISGFSKVSDAEREAGEWNQIEILCSGNIIVIAVNGKIVNWTRGAEVTAGKIGFQSEGGPVEFRNAVLRPIE